MHHIPAAVLLAQSIVDRAHVEEQETARPPGVSRLEHGIRRQIDEHERNSAPGKGGNGGRGVVPFRELRIIKRELLVQEFATRVVVLNRKPRTSKTVIGCRCLNQRKASLCLRRAQVTDLERGSIAVG